MSVETSFKQGFFTGFGVGAIALTAPVTGIVPLSLMGGAALGVALMVSFLVTAEIFGKLNERLFGLDLPMIARQMIALSTSPLLPFLGAKAIGIPLLFVVAGRVALCSSLLSLSFGYLNVIYNHSTDDASDYMRLGD